MNIDHTQTPEYLALDDDDRPFADLVTGWLDRVPATHRAMAQAGMVLLAAACDGYGDGLPADAAEIEERSAAHIYHAAYTQGAQDGIRQAAEFLTAELAARRADKPEQAA